MTQQETQMLRIGMIVGIGIAAAMLMAGCPTTTTNTGTGTSNNQLTDAEAAAVIATLSTTGSLASTTTTATNTTNIEDVDQETQSAAAIQVTTNSDGDIVFGTCPEVTIQADQSTATSSSIFVDFGDGCAPLGDDSLQCSGSASGTVSVVTRDLSLNFQQFTCGTAEITGDIDLGYQRGTNSVEFDGSWQLAYSDSTTDVDTDGAGTVEYNADDDQTTISTFTGTISDGTYEYGATLTDIEVSYTTYQNFIPFGGEAALSGDDIRTLNVRFNTNSPTTHVVEVSINGSAYFEVDLDEI